MQGLAQHLTIILLYNTLGTYLKPDNSYLVSDGRRELTSPQFQALAPTAGYSGCSGCSCGYLDTSFFVQLDQCSNLKNYLCEYKG